MELRSSSLRSPRLGLASPLMRDLQQRAAPTVANQAASLTQARIGSPLSFSPACQIAPPVTLLMNCPLARRTQSHDHTITHTFSRFLTRLLAPTFGYLLAPYFEYPLAPVRYHAFSCQLHHLLN